MASSRTELFEDEKRGDQRDFAISNSWDSLRRSVMRRPARPTDSTDEISESWLLHGCLSPPDMSSAPPISFPRAPVLMLQRLARSGARVAHRLVQEAFAGGRGHIPRNGPRKLHAVAYPPGEF